MSEKQIGSEANADNIGDVNNVIRERYGDMPQSVIDLLPDEERGIFSEPVQTVPNEDKKTPSQENHDDSKDADNGVENGNQNPNDIHDNSDADTGTEENHDEIDSLRTQLEAVTKDRDAFKQRYQTLAGKYNAEVKRMVINDAAIAGEKAGQPSNQESVQNSSSGPNDSGDQPKDFYVTDEEAEKLGIDPETVKFIGERIQKVFESRKLAEQQNERIAQKRNQLHQEFVDAVNKFGFSVEDFDSQPEAADFMQNVVDANGKSAHDLIGEYLRNGRINDAANVVARVQEIMTANNAWIDWHDSAKPGAEAQNNRETRRDTPSGPRTNDATPAKVNPVVTPHSSSNPPAAITGKSLKNLSDELAAVEAEWQKSGYDPRFLPKIEKLKSEISSKMKSYRTT